MAARKKKSTGTRSGGSSRSKKTKTAGGSKKRSTAKKKSPRRNQKPTSGTSGAGSIGGGPQAGQLVVVRKYENRRLYDTNESRYINLERVAEMVRDGVDVQVVEVKTDRDVTRQVLTQIIVESSRDKDGPPLEFLRDLIRANDRARRDFFQWYLASATEVYQSVRETFESAARRTPGVRLGALSKLWPANPIGQALARALSGEPGAMRQEASEDEEELEAEPQGFAQQEREELEELRSRLERIERRFGKS